MNAGDSTFAVIGKSVQIRGEVKGSEDLMVDGHVEGTITLVESRLTIGPNAHVSANVSARDVILLGQLSGNVSATGRVELRDGCDLVGDISAARLSIEESALFRGKVEPLQAEKAAGVAPAKGAEVPVATSPANYKSTLEGLKMMSIFPAGSAGLRSKTDDVMRNLFGKSQSDAQPSANPTVLTGPRIPRHSSAWKDLLKFLKAEQGLRILDIGPTSPTNINFLTTLGHGVYMADVVNEALRGNWVGAPDENGVSQFDVEGFLDSNLDFAGREFDVILLWTTLDYVPQALVAPMIKRFRSSLRPGGRVLTFFHTRNNGPDTSFCRYHVTDSDTIETQETTGYAVQHVYTNRTIEKLFETYANTKFYLAKDNLYEVIITR